MKKSIKWGVIGITVASFGVFATVVQQNAPQKKETKSYRLPSLADPLTEKEKQDRENWVESLDWQEGNWDVNGTQVFQTNGSMSPANNRTQVS
ncbi:hypothetical protein ACFDTO_29525 [Microbacteriaceae bacterium 4G12]